MPPKKIELEDWQLEELVKRGIWQESKGHSQFREYPDFNDLQVNFRDGKLKEFAKYVADYVVDHAVAKYGKKE